MERDTEATPELGAERSHDPAADHVQAPKQQGDTAHQVEKNNASHQLLSSRYFNGQVAKDAFKARPKQRFALIDLSVNQFHRGGRRTLRLCRWVPRLQSLAFVAVLFAAACHAGRNALTKVAIDPSSSTTLIAVEPLQ
jgi:hypothetical protein